VPFRTRRRTRGNKLHPFYIRFDRHHVIHGWVLYMSHQCLRCHLERLRSESVWTWRRRSHPISSPEQPGQAVSRESYSRYQEPNGCLEGRFGRHSAATNEKPLALQPARGGEPDCWPKKGCDPVRAGRFAQLRSKRRRYRAPRQRRFRGTREWDRLPNLSILTRMSSSTSSRASLIVAIAPIGWYVLSPNSAISVAEPSTRAPAANVSQPFASLPRALFHLT